VRVFVSGPSGVGKTTVIKEVLRKNPDLVLSVSYTTRAPRKDEQDGVDYFFVSRDTFEDMVRKGAFLEWANVHGNLYGTSIEWVEEMESRGFHVLFDIDVQGVKQAKEKGLQGCFILIVPPTIDELERRLHSRGTEDRDSLVRRMENARAELAMWNLYDYLVVNDSLLECIETVHAVILAQRASKSEMIGRLPWLHTIA